ncbi:tRNA lysidine(34) synthetase TilS [Roseibium suaedae]|uniref:tRNA(Ile)-lysidine synthase n=1 Tax=Roseibium suaedae TaxID=735517 RepID=A0A1M7IN77_9HYPH|nr:tRNA lysidine(34) synthetase TilS [Roseibium suaedae]SHM42038.1 tRNA(Ile)-lysidine synthase [Roseibium suaedae]
MTGLPDADSLAAADAKLDATAFDQLFSFLKSESSLAVGVSGGADSLCLLHALAQWRDRGEWGGVLYGLTVDHGLRPESAAEAEMVATQCRELGVPQETLCWAGPKPRSNVQAEARGARYRLFREAMQRLDLKALVLAHHQDDQSETFLDRLTRGSGVTGLSSMKQIETNGPEGIRILRPLLSVPKSRLVATLEAAGTTWAEDPSNSSTSYKRVRLRRMADQLAEEGLSANRILSTVRNMQRAETALDQWVDAVEAAQVLVHEAGPLKLDFGAYAALPDEIRLRLLARLTVRASSRKDRPRLEKLEEADQRLCAGDPVRLTLNGCILDVAASCLTIWREAGRALAVPLLLTPDEEVQWDGRYRCQMTGSKSSGNGALWFGALADAPEPVAPMELPQHWSRAAFRTAPAVWNETELLHVPGLYSAREWTGLFRIHRL